MPKLFKSASALFLSFYQSKFETFFAIQLMLFTVNNNDSGDCIFVYPANGTFRDFAVFPFCIDRIASAGAKPLEAAVAPLFGKSRKESDISVVALE